MQPPSQRRQALHNDHAWAEEIRKEVLNSSHQTLARCLCPRASCLGHSKPCMPSSIRLGLPCVHHFKQASIKPLPNDARSIQHNLHARIHHLKPTTPHRGKMSTPGPTTTGELPWLT